MRLRNQAIDKRTLSILIGFCRFLARDGLHEPIRFRHSKKLAQICALSAYYDAPSPGFAEP